MFLYNELRPVQLPTTTSCVGYMNTFDSKNLPLNQCHHCFKPIHVDDAAEEKRHVCRLPQ